jgi:hypothetical protein
MKNFLFFYLDLFLDYLISLEIKRDELYNKIGRWLKWKKIK